LPSIWIKVLWSPSRPTVDTVMALVEKTFSDPLNSCFEVTSRA
jgi:hypothetical protein